MTLHRHTRLPGVVFALAVIAAPVHADICADFRGQIAVLGALHARTPDTNDAYTNAGETPHFTTDIVLESMQSLVQ